MKPWLFILWLVGCGQASGPHPPAQVQQESAGPLELGRALLQQRRYPEALAAYQEARRLYPDSGEACAGLGRAYLALGDADQALGFYEMAATLEEGNAGLRLTLGHVYLQLNRLDQAEATLQRAMALDTSLAFTAHHHLGAVYTRQGRHSMAAQQFEAALSRRTDHVQTRYNLALVWLHLGRLAQARQELERVLEAQPGAAAAACALGEILAKENQPDQALAA
ncbi:MAG: tetratricopeptide repeat protein, partial [Candidatus Handelsmanbacteria bacterium]|nr:tetratricopeptide repeat protein [Candidatus Handelsmanbacteria bacterium]